MSTNRDLQPLVDIVREHYNLTCEIWRPLILKGSEDLVISGGPCAQVAVAVPFTWIATQTFDLPIEGLGLAPVATHDSTDKAYFLDTTDIQSRDFFKLTAPGHPNDGWWFVVVSIPEAFWSTFRQYKVLFRMTGKPAGVP